MCVCVCVCAGQRSVVVAMRALTGELLQTHLGCVGIIDLRQSGVHFGGIK